MERDTIIYSSIRSFCKGIFFILGFLIASIIAIAIVAGMLSSNTDSLERTTTPKILTDAHGNRTTSSTAPVILQINIHSAIGLENLSMDKVRTQLVESREGDLKDRVKGILISINSPGGTVIDADGIYRAIKEYKERYKVPVVAHVDGLCASGGYYIACSADKIFSTSASLIGSVGVLFPTFLNASQLLEKIGVQTLTVSSGKGKDDMNPLRPWKPGEDLEFKTLSNYFYGYFVDIVTTNRPEVNKEKLIAEYGASVFPAEQAKTIGFIDITGANRSDALSYLAKELNLEDKTYQVIELESASFLSQLLRAESPILTGQVKHQVSVSNFDEALSGKFLYMYRPEMR